MLFIKDTLKSGGAKGWLLQRITGLFLIILLFVHFFILHFTGTGKVNFKDAAMRLSDPFWKTTYLIFLAVALWHGLYGVWLIAEDYFSSFWLRSLIFIALFCLGILGLAIGVITIIPFHYSS